MSQLENLEQMEEVEEMAKLEVELDKSDQLESELETRLEELKLKVEELESFVSAMQVWNIKRLQLLFSFSLISFPALMTLLK